VLKGSIARTGHVSILFPPIEGPKGVPIRILGSQSVPVLSTDGVRARAGSLLELEPGIP
jgi:hypothetical protein